MFLLVESIRTRLSLEVFSPTFLWNEVARASLSRDRQPIARSQPPGSDYESVLNLGRD